MEKKTEITAQPFRAPPNPMAELVALAKEQGAALGDLQATMQATRLAVFALIDTHPAPEKAFAAFLDHMDHASDKLAPDRLPRYAAAMQQYRDALSAAAALQAKR